jgi:HAD superfamily hydrolase (TIGR01549 family)
MLKKAEIFIKNNGQPKKEFTDIRSKVFSIAEKYELEAAKTTSLLPGALETLKNLKKMNLKIGLCTINSKKSANFILKRFGIAEFFDAITPRDNVSYVKPNIEHLEATLKALNAKPEDTIIVGDSRIDVKCGRELKTIAVGLPTGVSSPKELINSGANYLITSLTDLPNLVEYINKISETENK